MIQQTIQQYLIQYKKCPLPAIGTLELVEGNASAWHAEKIIKAPVPFLLFSHRESDPSELIAFIADQEQITREDAAVKLQGYCARLNGLQHEAEETWPSLGTFFVDAQGKLSFKQAQLPTHFFPDLTADRLVRADAIHQMTVGDTETNSEEMAAYFEEQSVRKPDRWWVWAILWLGLAASLAGFYFYQHGTASMFGKTGKPVLKETWKTYRVPQ